MVFGASSRRRTIRNRWTPLLFNQLHSNSSNSLTRMSSINYSPLNEEQDEIRLITILPSNRPSSLVRCQLETVSLKLLTPGRTSVRNVLDHREQLTKSTKQSYRFRWGDYAALSYVWGDQSRTLKIVVNGQETRVGQNLEVALRALSSRGEFANDYKLWVDAICINQVDLEERSRQIGRMQGIYSSAWAVIAWIGKEAEGSTQAIQLVHALSEVSREAESHGEALVARLYQEPEYLGNGSWTALNNFMARPYWYRLWIIQEIVLGSSRLELRCGNASIDWHQFCCGIGFLRDYLWIAKDHLLARELLQRGLQENVQATWGTVSLHLIYQHLWPLSYDTDKNREWLNFTQLLDVANAAESHDARDKVYGLVGLIDPLVSQQLIPDYRLDASKVFGNITKTFIQTYKNLDPIREGNLWSWTNTPSWAADWTWNGRLRYSRPETALWGSFWIKKGRPSLAQASLPYCASGTEVFKASFSNDDMHLTCKGFLIDEVDGLSAREFGYFKWAEMSIVQPEQNRNAYGDVNGIQKALYTTLVMDRVAGGEKATSRHATIFNLPATFVDGYRQFKDLGWEWLPTIGSYYFRWEEWRGVNRNFRLMGKKLDDYFTDIIPIDASEYDYSEVYSCFDRTSKGRRFMTTREGYLGWAPDNAYGDDENQTWKGDLIAIIFGCSTPLVIRPYGELFQIVGEAYVQGLMDGEAIEGLRTGKFQVRDFTFC